MLPQLPDDALSMTRYILKMMNLEDLPLSVKAHTQNWIFETVMPDGQKALIRLKGFFVPEGTSIMLPGLEQPIIPNPMLGIYPADAVFFSACELYALRKLTGNTTLALPRPLERITYGLSELVIFSYVPGESRTPETLTAKDAARCGAFLAQLHNESRRLIFRSPPDSRLNAEGLLGETSRYASPDEKMFLSTQDQALLDTLRQHVADVETRIGLQSEHTLLLHGDFLLQNILFEGDKIGALDFEMCGWGTDFYDVATFLWQMKTSPRYDKIADAFWRGYTFWRELPPREWLEVFIAARHGASVRWLIQNRYLPDYAEQVPALIRQSMDEIAGFLDTGVLKRA